MKKFLKIALMIILMASIVMLFTGCSKEDETENKVIVSLDEIDRGESVIEDMYNTGKEIDKSLDKTLEKTASNAEKQAMDIFNSQFEVFEESSVNSATIRALISTIQRSNQTDEEKQVSIEGITSVSEISKNSTYSVEFKKDSEGYINKVIITEN